jgi:hypothetical protein
MAGLGPPPCYFFAPTRNYEPDKRIKLGNIITNPSAPDEPLNTLPAAVDQKDVEVHNEQDWALGRGSNSDVQVGVFTSFLQLILGVGADVSAGQANKQNTTLSCKTIITHEFNPSTDFIAKALEDDGVQKFLKKNKESLFKSGTKKVYMINGVKIASGASMVVETARERNVHLHAAVDGTATGLPVSAGTNIDIKRGTNQGQSFKSSDDFVLGFRVRRIKLSAKGEMTHTQFKDGATLGISTGDGADDFEFSFALDDVDASGHDIGRADFAALDEFGKEFVVCVNPT